MKSTALDLEIIIRGTQLLDRRCTQRENTMTVCCANRSGNDTTNIILSLSCVYCTHASPVYRMCRQVEEGYYCSTVSCWTEIVKKCAETCYVRCFRVYNDGIVAATRQVPM